MLFLVVALDEIFEGVFSDNRKIFTKTMERESVYGERLVEDGGCVYREWVPFRSKLGAAIKNGLKELPVKAGSNVLYLGSSEGTTPSHVSDIIGEKGILVGVEISERPMKKFIAVCESRQNVLPVLADANKPQDYAEYLEGVPVDVLYQDISQKNQAEIFNKNAKAFLAKGKHGLIAIKARSISQKNSVKKIFEEQVSELKNEFEIIQEIALEPFEKGHLMVLCRKK
ncbi:MAG: fibrillarin-like rRNA/tRNA 2'-O-methyltransferase [Candidatus Diapherotrites archaeon]|nr:fibrillarin-like rRNA/tRNA 2'-O-methyltransferase [Candidatus Diapherotrites archaeon]